MNNVNKRERFIVFILVLIIGLISVYPLIWMFFNSFKGTAEILGEGSRLIPEVWQFENYTNALKAAPFLQYMWNSLWTTILIVVLQLFLSSLLAYALTQFHFKGREVLFGIVLGTYMLPSAVTYIPSFILLSKMNLTDNLWGLVFSNLANVFMIFLLRQNFKSTPKEVIEAARVEGISEWSILWRIVVPINRNTIINASLISFIANFNTYLWPSILLRSQKNYVIQQGLNQFSTTSGSFTSTFPLIMAATALTVIPLIIVYILLQRYFVGTSSQSSIKG